MRNKYSKKNIKISLIYYFINVIFSFVTKSIFIHYLGLEYNGLNSLINNLLNILNITELGLSTAVACSLYKPLSKNKHKEINEILCLYKYMYQIISVIVTLLGLIILLFLPCFVHTTIDITTIRISYILFLISTVLSYLMTYLNILPIADQKNYMIVKIQGNIKIIKNIIQLILIITFKSYIAWLIIEIIFTIIMYLLINRKIKKQYTWYKNIKNQSFKKLYNKNRNIITQTKNIVYHKIGAILAYQTDNIIISYFCNLTIVGIYGNYILIYNLITGCIDQVFYGLTSSIGNLIVESKSEKVYTIWKEIYAIMFFAATICFYLFCKLANPFINLWIGGECTFSNSIVIAIGLTIWCRIIKITIDKFRDAYGIFWDKFAPILEAIINLVLSIILTIKIGVIGVVIGTIISNIVITLLWKPYLVFKYGFKKSIKNNVIDNIKLTTCAVFAIIICETVNSLINIRIDAFWTFVIYALLVTTISIVISNFIFSINKTYKESIKKYICVMLKK